MNIQITKNLTAGKNGGECCMCGDYGFAYELFQCKICQFRSQHRYCSNLYPNVGESHRICNWCLSHRDDAKLDKSSQNSSNSSSSFQNDTNIINSPREKTKKLTNGPIGDAPVHRRSQSRSGVIGPIKKQRSTEIASSSPEMSGRKRIVTAAEKEAAERLRRTRSEGLTRQVFRNRVRRYKLLDEVST